MNFTMFGTRTTIFGSSRRKKSKTFKISIFLVVFYFHITNLVVTDKWSLAIFEKPPENPFLALELPFLVVRNPKFWFCSKDSIFIAFLVKTYPSYIKTMKQTIICAIFYNFGTRTTIFGSSSAKNVIFLPNDII